MFCSSLRQRPDTAALIPLLSSSTNPRLQETTIQSHDLALPAPDAPYHPPHNRPHQKRFIHFLILTPTFLKPTNQATTLERISRLSSLSDYHVPAIAFIPDPQGHPSTAEAFAAFSELQVLLHTLPTAPPALLINRPTNLLPLAQRFAAGLSQSKNTAPHSQPSAVLIAQRELLLHATSSAPERPMSEHDAFVVGDLCHSLREMVEMMETEGGREVLRRYVGEREARGMAEFWEEEWLCE